jgi:hypothetical protein
VPQPSAYDLESGPQFFILNSFVYAVGMVEQEVALNIAKPLPCELLDEKPADGLDDPDLLPVYSLGDQFS